MIEQQILDHPPDSARTMTIREIGGIRGIQQPMETVGTARVSRNVDLIASGGGIGRRCAAAPSSRRPIGRFTSFLYDCTFLRLLFVRRISIYYLRESVQTTPCLKSTHLSQILAEIPDCYKKRKSGIFYWWLYSY